MSDKRQLHWETAYAQKGEDTVSWFEQQPRQSLALIDAAGVSADDPLIDIGGGASRLVDELLARGYNRISVLDVATKPLEIAKRRLGPRASEVSWIVQDITCWNPPADGYVLWHDRAVFHFLTDDEDLAAYLRAVNRALRPHGHIVLATFALSGPERCSGLPVRRYGADDLRAVFGANFELLTSLEATHQTQSGAHQNFTWCLFRKTGV